MPDPTDLGERAFTAVSNVFKKGQEGVKRQTRIIRLQTQISNLRSKRTTLLVEMGEKVYDLFQRDLVKNQDLRVTCQEIRGIDADIAMKREELERIGNPESRTEGGIDDDPNSEVIEDEIIRG
jgi:hypothetical protein